MTLHLCGSVFPALYQYTIKCVLCTRLITRFTSRYSSVKLCFRMSLQVAHSEHRIKLIILQFLRISPMHFIFIKRNVLRTYKRGGQRDIILWLFSHSQTIAAYQNPVFASCLLALHIVGRKDSSNFWLLYLLISRLMFHSCTQKLWNQDFAKYVRWFYIQTLLTYLLIHSMEQSPSWEANWFCS